MNMHNVLVTGANGFVGSALCDRLLRMNKTVVGLVRDRNYKSRRDVLDKISVVYGDIRDYDTVRYAVSKYEIDTIFHVGAITILKMATVDPKTCFQVNVMGTVNVLEAARECGHVSKVVVASCYDEKTRALTTEGFKTYDKINPGDFVWSLNPATREMEAVEVEEVVVQDYNGTMVNFKGKRLDFSVTPNHRMVVEKGHRSLDFIPADNKVPANGWRLPEPVWYGDKDAQLPALPDFHWNVKKMSPDYCVEDVLYLLGIYIGDGVIEHQPREVPSKTGLTAREYINSCRGPEGRFISPGKVGEIDTITKTSNVIYLYIPRNDPARPRVEATLTRLGIDFHDWDHGGEGALVFTSAELCYWFADSGRYAHEKTIPEWALRFDYPRLRCLLEGLLESDGDKRARRQLTTVSWSLVEKTVELGLKCRRSVGFSYREAPENKPSIKGREINSKGSYQVYLSKSSRSVLPKHKEEVRYLGKVWCLRLKENKNFLVERGGRIAFCGNSDKAYGNHEILPYKEDFALLASDPYSTSKSCTDLITQAYSYTYGLDTSIVRSGNIFGPGDLNKSRIIPGSILRVLKGERPIIYSGVGNYKREFMYISDVIDAYMFVQDRGLAGEAYNIGGSGFHTIFDTVHMIIEEMGVDMEPVVVKKDFIEIKEQYLDATKLRELGWECNHSTRKGIRASIPWYKEYSQYPEKFYWGYPDRHMVDSGWKKK